MVPVTGSGPGAAPGPSLMQCTPGLQGVLEILGKRWAELLPHCCMAEPKRSECCSLPPVAP